MEATKTRPPRPPAGAARGPLLLREPEDVVEFVRKNRIPFVDLKFSDLLGTWQHVTLSARKVNAELFAEGHGFDGSSIRGFQSIHESDMLLVPDPTTAFLDPATAEPTLSLLCNIVDPETRRPYSRDPRHIAQKAEQFLARSGLATHSFWGPEVEFFVFDHVRFDQGMNFGFYFLDAHDGIWNSGKESNGVPNLGYRARPKEGYFPAPPTDGLQDFRSEAVKTLESCGVAVDVHHHEVATAGQGEITMRFSTLTKMADSVFKYKYVLRNLAKRRNKTVTFMPKPLFGDNGSGMHVHSSLWKGEKPLFADPKGWAGVSTLCRWYIGGLLKHSPAILALAAPTTNSYRRLVPGYEAPVNLCYSKRNRSAACRIPVYSRAPAAARVEYRPPDPSSNPYLTFSAILMAGLDGIRNKIDPGEPIDKDIFELPPEEAQGIPQVPTSLEQALCALEQDHEFLLQGEVFTQDVLNTWISLKRRREADAVRLRPHPYEFYLYYDL